MRKALPMTTASKLRPEPARGLEKFCGQPEQDFGTRTLNRRHGGPSPGAPRGSKNGNFKHGDWTADAIAERKWLRSLVQSFADNGASEMKELKNPPASIPVQDRLPPVRVKLQQADAYTDQTCPPDGESAAWEARASELITCSHL